jgi:hypothetical protein
MSIEGVVFDMTLRALWAIHARNEPNAQRRSYATATGVQQHPTGKGSPLWSQASLGVKGSHAQDACAVIPPSR